jgi:hypothetical protein
MNGLSRALSGMSSYKVFYFSHLVSDHDVGDLVLRPHREDVVSRFSLTLANQETPVLPGL